jgi:hypothetical protein
MPIIHYPGYMTKEEAAARKKVQVRAINEQIRKKKWQTIKVDGFVFVKDHSTAVPPPPDILLSSLEWVFRCARKNNLTSDPLYEQIVFGKVTGVVVVNRVFVIRTEPALLAFLQIARKK